MGIVVIMPYNYDLQIRNKLLKIYNVILFQQLPVFFVLFFFFLYLRFVYSHMERIVSIPAVQIV